MKTRAANRSRVLTLAQKVRKLLGSSKNWLQGDWAQNAQNMSVEPTSKEAVRFCLEGAVQHLSKKGSNTAKTFLSALEAHMPKTPDNFGIPWEVNTYNDEHNHRSVIALLDRTIRTLQK